MLLAIGTRVKFRHTGDEGVVTALLGDGMVNVFIVRERMEIPAFEEDLIRAEDVMPYPPKTIVKAKVIQTPETPQAKRPLVEDAKPQYTILKSMGIQLAFDPVPKPDGSPGRYHIFLINDTRYDVLFTLRMTINGQTKISEDNKMPSVSTLRLGELLFDELNDSPQVDLSCWRITTEGKSDPLEKSFKIKPQQFFKNVLTAPLLNKQVHLYRVFESLDASTTREEDLKTYTQRSATPSKFRQTPNTRRSAHEVEEFAHFVPEIDLHIEQLNKNHHKLTKAEMIRIQLSHFDEFMAKAIRLGIPRVYIIHGVGKGRLRDEISSRLLNNSDVITFRNEYHPRYGYGATEVILIEA